MDTEMELCKALQVLDMSDFSSRGFCVELDDENVKFYTIEHGLVEMERIDEPTSLGKYYEILVDIKAEYNPTENSFEIVEIYKEKVPTMGTGFMLATLKGPYKKKISPQCPFCDKRFGNEMSLKKHFLKKHKEMVEFKQCLKCLKLPT
ncbi:hypothetical protein B9Z55_027655 [Caenorhabditis nigoni]|uniref:C2H2-type domain-containing protein n=1 Tax=Caenorhabditis nigoni TaxID=1611254 RepID=A0A2G5SEU1_9PELO|nr:hypothetical protein B9Z55_027655 [Caenorhabditis nigoni]